VVEGFTFFGAEEFRDVLEGWSSTNVGVHGRCICSEEKCGWWDVDVGQQLFKSVGILKK
jgi:hypothetical protein